MNRDSERHSDPLSQSYTHTPLRFSAELEVVCNLGGFLSFFLSFFIYIFFKTSVNQLLGQKIILPMKCKEFESI